MARWELGASNGLLKYSAKRGAAFIVASNAVRFRKELKPLQAFEVHSHVSSADDRQMHITQIMRSGKDGRAHAGSVVRAVLRMGRNVLSPLEVMAALGADKEVGDAAQAPTCCHFHAQLPTRLTTPLITRSRLISTRGRSSTRLPALRRRQS